MNMNDNRNKEEDYERLVEQESLILAATEMIEQLLEESETSRKELADRLGRSKGFVTQILAGDRNMTMRTLADLAFALEHRVKMVAVPLLEEGHGGSASPAVPVSRARVWPGAGEPLGTKHVPDQLGDAPRRPVAAEGIGTGHTYLTAAVEFSAAPEEGLQLHIEPLPAELLGELETVAG